MRPCAAVCRVAMGAVALVAPSTLCAEVVPPPERVVVRVNDVTLHERDVTRAANRLERPADRTGEWPQQIRTAIARELVRRELARQYLRRSQWGAKEAEVEPQAKQIESNLAARGISLEDHLRTLGHDRASWQRELHWRLAWKRYRAQFVTDENLRKHFQRHRRDYDGTRRRAAHIFWKRPSTDAQEKALDRLVAEAREVRARIAAGEISFEEAARRYSKAPSAARGGDIGWVERRAPMSEPFSRALFALEVGQVSDIVRSPHGVHLIRCIGERPGTLSWQDVRTDLRRDVERFLLTWLAEQMRRKSRIEWHAPYDSPDATSDDGSSSESTSRIM